VEPEEGRVDDFDVFLCKLQLLLFFRRELGLFQSVPGFLKD
jgi:hypothetical protein